MQMKAILILFVLSCFTACSHIKTKPIDTTKTTPAQQDQKTDQGSVLSESGSNNSTHNDTTSTVPESTPNGSEGSVISSTATIAEIDVLELIKMGFEFPDLHSKHVDDYLKWNISHPTYLADLFNRAEPFLYFIVEELEKRNMPTELALIPAIESAYKPHATSRSGAAGLWQFIRSTGKHFGVRQSWWYDGRRDALASTYAALDYFTELHNKFDGDWFLALAAYNAGQGTVQRAINKNIRKGRPTNYQNLDLRSETKRYVPKLIALKKIISNPQRYGVDLRAIQNRPYFEVVNLPRQTNLENLINETGIDGQLFRHLNASYLQWATPPEGPHRFIMPLSLHPETTMALKKLSEAPHIEYQRHLISQGDNLGSIASRYGVSVDAIKRQNDIQGSFIRAGNTLVIPIMRNPAIDTSVTQAPKQNQSQRVIHRVVKGDTLWSISRRYKVQLDQLLAWNQLTATSILKLNQALLVFR